MPIHTSRSKIVSHFTCPRYRYLRYHYGGRGLQRVAQKHPTNAGLSIHAGNACVLNGKPVDTAVQVVVSTYIADFMAQFDGLPQAHDILTEQVHFIEGSVRAFARCRAPQIRRDYDVVAIEVEQSVPLTPEFIVYDFRADAILRGDMGIIVLDHKPSPYGGYKWVQQWERNHQVLAYVWAAQEIYKPEPVLGVQIEGYVRGKRVWEEKFGRKIQRTPLCYVWENEFSGQISPDYQRAGGWQLVPLWDTSMSTKEYIEEFLTAEQVEKLFLAPVPPICPTPKQIERWVRQTKWQEERVEENARLVERYRLREPDMFEDALDRRFPQNMDSCLKYGEDYPCEMDAMCFNEQVFEDPLASGLLEERQDHHTTEDTDAE